MDMVYTISTYLDDISFLCSFGIINDSKINKRRDTINRHRVAHSLQVRLIEPLGLSFLADIDYFTSLIKNSNDPVEQKMIFFQLSYSCLLYTSDAADE